MTELSVFLLVSRKGILLPYAMTIEEINPANRNEHEYPKLTVKISKGASVASVDGRRNCLYVHPTPDSHLARCALPNHFTLPHLIYYMIMNIM